MLVTVRPPAASQINNALFTRLSRETVSADSFAAVLRRYQRLGGLAGGEEVVSRLRSRLDQPISSLARWVVNREVVVLPCEFALLLPLFQFDFDAGRVKPAVSALVGELRGVFDDWDLVSWFATPNTLLGVTMPMSNVDGDWRAVLEAARTDRFIAAG